jgi:hypothetical protein
MTTIMTIQQPILSLIAGVLILIFRRLLNFIVAILNRRRPCGLNSLTAPDSLPAHCRNEPGQTTLSELEWRSFKDSWEKEGCHEAAYPSPTTPFLDRRYTDSKHASLTELNHCNIHSCHWDFRDHPWPKSNLLHLRSQYRFDETLPG